MIEFHSGTTFTSFSVLRRSSLVESGDFLHWSMSILLETQPAILYSSTALVSNLELVLVNNLELAPVSSSELPEHSDRQVGCRLASRER